MRINRNTFLIFMEIFALKRAKYVCLLLDYCPVFDGLFKRSWKQHNVKFFTGEIGSTYLDFFPAPWHLLAGSPDSFCSFTSAHARKIRVKKVIVVANAKTVWWYRAQQNTTGCFETNRKFEFYIIKYIIHKKRLKHIKKSFFEHHISEVHNNAYHRLLAFYGCAATSWSHSHR